ncbi:MAG TPA: hypothetical protein VIK06_10405 [Candidatus Limnocylindrales bacterium]
MLRDVVVHLHNEQPLLADLLAPPTAGDSCLVCTNLRAMNGKPPVFIERSDSTFVFPLVHVCFIEIRAGHPDDGQVALLPATTGLDVEADGEPPAMETRDEDPEPVDVLRRIRGE